MPTGAENGTYDMIVSTTGLSLKKITRKYGAMISNVSGQSSSSRCPPDARPSRRAAANSEASSTNPNRKNTANQTIGRAEALQQLRSAR